MERAWSKIGTGSPAMKKAQQLAASGKVVVVGAKRLELKDKHGHVAVVTPKFQGNWPILYGGGSGTARSPGTKTLDFVFRAEFHPLLRYYAAPTTVVPSYD
jgi:hypothetical protein